MGGGAGWEFAALGGRPSLKKCLRRGTKGRSLYESSAPTLAARKLPGLLSFTKGHMVIFSILLMRDFLGRAFGEQNSSHPRVLH